MKRKAIEKRRDREEEEEGREDGRREEEERRRGRDEEEGEKVERRGRRKNGGRRALGLLFGTNSTQSKQKIIFNFFLTSSPIDGGCLIATMPCTFALLGSAFSSCT